MRFDINGIKVKAVPVGGGMYMGVPEDMSQVPEIIQKVLSGQFGSMSDLRVTRLEDTPEPVKASVEEPVKQNVKEPKPGSLAAWRSLHGYSKTAAAEYFGVSRSTYTRWENAGKTFDEACG